MSAGRGVRLSVCGVGETALWSHRIAWTELLVPVSVEAGRSHLDLDVDWTRRWSVSWMADRESRSLRVRDLMDAPLSRVDPIRGFSWRRGQRHRPGLEYLVSTGRLHGCESQTEARVLIALDFLGGLVDVVSQPVKVRFGTGCRMREHTPDYLAVTRSGVWLIDVRPEALIRDEDRESFAAAAELALACGWHYAVAADWRPSVWAAVDALSSQRRPISDPLGLRPDLLAALGPDGVPFGELAAGSRCEPVARAQLLHLIWHRRFGIDLSQPLGDRSIVVAGSAGGS